jgi:cell shape-determining protein MreC
MTARSRHLLIAAGLLALTLLLTAGLGWRRLSTVARPWQRGLAPGGGDTALVDQLQSAREQVVQLNAENVVLRTRLEEYRTLRGEGGILLERTVVVRARIIGRTLRLGRRYCELDAGAVDGVAKGMAACAGLSLVGMVVGVQDGRCLVQQVTDSESRIPATLFDGPKLLAEGVLAGTGQRGLLLLEFIEDRSGLAVTPGMQVVTAGSDGRLPPGLVLGAVSAAARSTTADHWRVEVSPLRSAEAAESLLVLNFQPPER